MGIIRDVQRSRPLQLLIGFIGLVFFYYFCVRSPTPASPGSDSYTNEELNDILQGDSHSDLNDFNIHKRSIESLQLKSPLLSTTTLELINYVNKGNTLISNDRIRLISDKPHQLGSISSKTTIPEQNSFEMELEFNINGLAVKNGLYGDGLAIWLTDEPIKQGDVFGAQNNWKGLGLFIDTYQNNMDKSYKTTGFPYASLQMNDGSVTYDKATDGVKTELAGCSLSKVHNVRSGRSKMRLIYLRESGYLSVDFDVRNNGNWKNCFTVDANVDVPTNLYIGFSGETGDLSHNVDLYSFEVFGLFDDEGNPVKSIKLINEDLQHHLKQEEEEEKEVPDVVQSKQRHRLIKKQKSARNKQNRRRTLTRLHKLEKRLKLKNADLNRAKYNGHDNVFSYLWSLIKKIMFWFFIIVVLYIVSIIVRLWLDKRRLRKGNYYKGGIL